MRKRLSSAVLSKPSHRLITALLSAIALALIGVVLFAGTRETQGIGVVTATKVDTFAPGGDVDGDGKADPGDTLRYTVTITNSTGADITGASFADTIDSNTTFVVGSLHVSTIARNDAYSTVGNVSISIGAPGVLANDSDLDGGTLTASGSGSSTQGGTFSVNGDGSFTYDPPSGFDGTDTFTYTATGATADTATVSVTVSGMIWFVSNTGASCTALVSNCGRQANPFSTLAALAGINNGTGSNPAAGDNIFVYESATPYAGGITLLGTQKLIGQDSTSSLATITGLAQPTGATYPSMNSGNGTLTDIRNAGGNGVTLGSGDVLNGFTAGASSGVAVSGSSFGTLTVDDVKINTTGAGLSLTTGTLAGTGFPSITSSGGTNNVLLSGVAGPAALGSGALSGSSSEAFKVDGGTDTVTYSGTITNSTNRAVSIANKTTSGNVTLSGLITSTGSGIFLNSNGGATVTLSGGMSVSTGANPAFTATNGGTVVATQNNTSIVNTLTTTTGTALNVVSTNIGASGVTFRSISANGAASGIVLNNTGSSGGLTVTGSGSTTVGGDSSGGTIQNTTSHGISLNNTQSPSFTNMNIQNSPDSGIFGSQVVNFTFDNGTINNSGTSLGAFDSNIAFSDGGVTTATPFVSGIVTITDSVLTLGFYDGVDIQNFTGTISNLNISNNTITSSTSTATSKAPAIRIIAFGGASAAASVTTATINANDINNFPSDSGIMFQCGNVTSETSTGSTCGSGGANVVNITNNDIRGESIANRIGTQGILFNVTGVGTGNFNVSGNTVMYTVGNSISHNVFGDAIVTTVMDNNTVVSENCCVGSAGIAGGTSNSSGFVTNDPRLTLTLTNNTVSQTDGNGILIVARDNATGQLNLTIKSNTVSAPLGGVRPGIRVDAGNASGDNDVCLDINGNKGPGVAGVGGSGGHPGIGLRKQGTSPTVNAFGIEGMGATATPLVEQYVDGLNDSEPSPFHDGDGVLLISATSGFSNCSSAPFAMAIPAEGGMGDTYIARLERMLAADDEMAVSATVISDAPISIPRWWGNLATLAHVDAVDAAAVMAPRRSLEGAEFVSSDPLAAVAAAMPASAVPDVDVALGTLNSLQVVTITFDVKINTTGLGSATQVCNQGTLHYDPSIALLTGPSIGSTNPTCTALDVADLSLNKSVNDDTPTVGDTIHYTLALNNAGGQTATNVQVTDVVPAGLTISNIEINNVAGGSESGGTITWDMASVAIGTTNLTYDALVLNTIADPAVNTAQVTASDQIDPDSTPNDDLGDDYDTQSIDPQFSDVSLTKTVDLAQQDVGSNVVFTVKLSNAGPDPAAGVVVTDLLPTGLSYVSSLASQGSYITGVWTAGTVAVGTDTATLTITAQVTGSGLITNTAEVTAATTYDTDSTPNDATGDDYDTADVTGIPHADLAVDKSVDDDTPDIGQTITYTVSVENNGPQDSANVVVVDVIPAGLTVNEPSISNGGVYASGPRTITWNLGTLNDTTVNLTYDALVTSGVALENVVNTVTVTSDTDDPTTPNVDTQTIDPQDADLSVTKTVDNDQPNPGNNVVFTVTVTNNGNDTSVNTAVNDLLPAGLTYVSDDGSGDYVSGTGVWTIGSLAASGSATLHITATAASTPATNTATVSSGTFDPDTNNNSDSVTVTPAAVDLTLTKTDNDTSAELGDTQVYTIHYDNVGLHTATGVVITETVPAGTTFDATNSSAWDCADNSPAGTTCHYTVGSLPVLTSASNVTFAVTVDSTLAAGVDVIDNTATIADDGSQGGDMHPADNTATDNDTAINAAPDLKVLKTDNDATSVPGGTIVYTLNYSNNGNQGATGVVITETVPANTTYTGSGWTCSPDANAGSTCTFAIGALAAGGSGSANFAVTVVNPVPAGVGQINNTASIDDDHANGADQNSSDNTSNTETTPVTAAPDIRVDKVYGGGVKIPGDVLTFTINVYNDGNQGAAGVVVTETVPANTTFSAANSTGTWTCLPDNSAGSTCTAPVGSIAGGGASTSIVFGMTVNNPVLAGVTQISNTASAADNGANGTDPTTNNNSDTETVQVFAAPNLGVTKTDDGASAPGAVIIYTIHYGNTGNQGATGVALTETVPVNTTFSATGSTAGWSCGAITAGSSCTFTIGALAGGGTITNTVNFAVKVDDPVPAGFAQVHNTVTIDDDHGNGTDPDASDNSGSKDTTVTAAADMKLSKSDGGHSAPPGSTITYQLSYFNQGHQGATGVVLHETVPANTTFNAGASDANWVCSPNGNAGSTCTRAIAGEVAGNSGGVITFAVTVAGNVAPGTIITNNASVSDDNQNGPDPDTNNNSAQANTLTVAADLNLDKTESIDPVVDGTQLTYEVKVRNDGPDNATGVIVQETLGPLPANVTIHSTNVSQGSYVSGTGVWTLGNLANGATATLTMVLDVGPFAPYQAVIHNSAAITAQDPPDSDTSDNQDTEDTTITAPQCMTTPRPMRTPIGQSATPFHPTPSPTPFCLTGPTNAPTASPSPSPTPSPTPIGETPSPSPTPPPPGTLPTARPTRTPHATANTFAAPSRLAEFW